VGHRGWLGVRLDRGFDRNEIAGIVEDAYAGIAPPKLLAAAAAAKGKRSSRPSPRVTRRP
jgi:hypothetical protein